MGRKEKWNKDLGGHISYSDYWYDVPDGKYLISGSYDSKIKIFDVNNNFELMGELEHTDRVVSCIWHPEIPLIISTSADKTARVWIPQKI